MVARDFFGVLNLTRNKEIGILGSYFSFMASRGPKRLLVGVRITFLSNCSSSVFRPPLCENTHVGIMEDGGLVGINLLASM